LYKYIIKLSFGLIKYHMTKAHEEVEVQIYTYTHS
jgi:hypothetical protein